MTRLRTTAASCLSRGRVSAGVLAGVILLATSAAPARSQTFTWQGPGGSAANPTTGSWNVGTNWAGGAVPTGSNIALNFGGAGTPAGGGYTATNNLGTFLVGSLTASNAGVGSTVEVAQTGGQVLQFNGGTITNASSGDLFVNHALQITGTGGLTVNAQGGGFIALGDPTAPGTNFIGRTGIGLRPLLVNSSGTGAVIVSGTNSYGTTTLTAGTLAAATDGALSTGAVAFNGGTLQASDVNGPVTVTLANAINIGSTAVALGGSTSTLVLNGAVDLGSATPTVTVTGGPPTQINGVVSGGAGVGLVKAGGGQLVLSAANTYTGPTTVSAGTLTLTGAGSFASSPTIQVNGGAILNVSGVTSGSNFANGGFALAGGQTLQGGGNVVGSVTATNGTTVAPGTASAVGTLGVSGNVTFQTGSVYDWTLSAATPAAAAANTGGSSAPGSTSDRLTAGGSLQFQPGSVVRLSSITTPTFDNTKAYSFNLASYSGAAPSFSGVTIDTSGSGFASYTGMFDLSAAGGTVYLNLTPIPEPALLLGAAAVGLLGMPATRRRLLRSATA